MKTLITTAVLAIAFALVLAFPVSAGASLAVHTCWAPRGQFDASNNTSCAFGRVVMRKALNYIDSHGGPYRFHDFWFRAFSPVTYRWYTVTCESGRRGGICDGSGYNSWVKWRWA